MVLGGGIRHLRILSFDGEVLECGRSCVDAAYRTRGSMQLLWSGIAAYIFKHDVAILFGCASCTAPISMRWRTN